MYEPNPPFRRQVLLEIILYSPLVLNYLKSQLENDEIGDIKFVARGMAMFRNDRGFFVDKVKQWSLFTTYPR